MSIDSEVRKILEENKDRFDNELFYKNLKIVDKPKKTILYPIDEMKEKIFCYNGKKK